MNEADKREFIQSFIKQMRAEDFSFEYIGEQLAIVLHALYLLWEGK